MTNPCPTRTEGLVAESISHHFDRAGHRLVLASVDLRVEPGEIVGLVGPSGVGKTTLARILTGRIAPSSGRVRVDGLEQSCRRGHMRSSVALIGQDPRGATSPRWTLRRTISEPAVLAGRNARGLDARINALAEQVLLDQQLLDRRPPQVSDGQLQRVCVARAIMQDAAYLVCDEPTSMLDPITTATIMAVLRDLAAQGRGVLVISHDHRLLKACATRIETLRQGR